MKLTRQFQVLAGLLALTCNLAHAETRKHPNVLLICIDDLRPQLGCYGDQLVKSPNIDKLSASAVTFDNCYVQVAVCNPSRASMMTGLRPNTLNCWTLDYHFRETKPEAVTLPQYLRQHGYHAEGYGKIFHNPWQDPRSWNNRHRFGRGNWNHYSKEQLAMIEDVRASLPDDAWQKSSLRGPVTNAPNIEDSEHPDGDMARIVCKRLSKLKNSDKPFFVAAGFVLPHLPWCPPKKYWDLYERDQIPLADNPYVPANTPAVALGKNYEFHHYADSITFPSPVEAKVSEEKAKRMIHGYLASTSFVDAQVGLILDTLEKEGLAENTIVVLWSDHGYKLGEHNGWGKMTNFEIDTRVPFIIRDPRAKANGQRSQRLVETLDIFPTVCDLTGIPAPEFTEGKSVSKLLNDPSAAHLEAAYSQYVYRPLIGNSIRTSEWRYSEWCDMKDGSVKHRVLYDHRSDHKENENVADKHPELIQQLQDQLRKVLPNQPLTLQPRIHSANSKDKVSVQFHNKHPGTVRLSWISPDGRRSATYDIKPGKTQKLNSFSGHVFVAESLDGKYFETIPLEQSSEDIMLSVSNN